MPEIIACTGHRPNKLDNDYSLTSPLVTRIKYEIIDKVIDLMEEHNPIPMGQGAYTTEQGKSFIFITGMALGIDTLFARIAIELGIKFIAAVPFKGQQRKWQRESIAEYHSLLSKAHKIVVVDTKKEYNNYADFMLATDTAFSPIKMHKRNEWMVDHCTKLLSVWDGTEGGTNNCINYANKVGREQIPLNLNDIRHSLTPST